MRIRQVTTDDKAEWIRMRSALWPDSPDDHPREVDRYFESGREKLAAFIAEDEHGGICGFVEAGTRPYAEGCVSSPVGYVEGWWVDPEYRERGVGRALFTAVESWARALGLTEIASDADVTNALSIRAHRALGYEEIERIVCLRKAL